MYNYKFTAYKQIKQYIRLYKDNQNKPYKIIKITQIICFSLSRSDKEIHKEEKPGTFF